MSTPRTHHQVLRLAARRLGQLPLALSLTSGASRRPAACAAALLVAVVTVSTSSLLATAHPAGHRAVVPVARANGAAVRTVPTQPGAVATGAVTIPLDRFVAAPKVAVGPKVAARAAAPSSTAPAPQSVAPVSQLALSGIPVTALIAYQNAALREAKRAPSCRLPWPLLAGIGRVESNHGRFAGAVLHSDGVSTPPIIGIPLNGHGTALIRDTDKGRLDGDTVFDRAVGPMQFIPSTWAGWGVDANHDGRKDPFNILDAAAAAADYLCAAGRDLATASGQVRAVLSYNHSEAYVLTVLGLERVYAGAAGIRVPILPTTPDPAAEKGVEPPSTLPPVDPGPPRALTPIAAHPAAHPTAAPTSARPSPSPSASPPAAGASPTPSPSPTASPTPSPTSSPTSSPSPTGGQSSTGGSSSASGPPSPDPSGTSAPGAAATAPAGTSAPGAASTPDASSLPGSVSG